MSDSIKIEPTPMDAIPVPLNLTVGMTNYLLKVLGRRPIEEALFVFNTIQSQGNEAVAKAREGAMPPLVATVVEASGHEAQ